MAENEETEGVRERRRSSERPRGLAELKDFGSTLYLRFDVPIPTKGPKKFIKTITEAVDATAVAAEETIEYLGDEYDRVTALLAKLLTGNESTTFAEFVEGKNATPFAKQLAFFTGVFFLLLGQYLAFQRPNLFGAFYALGALGLLVQKTILYSRSKQLYFMLDSGYMNTALLLVNVTILRRSPTLWKTNFMIANGLQLWGLVILNNSLSFHSMDKMSSVFLLYMPAVVTYVERHIKGHYIVSGMCTSGSWQCELSPVEAFVLPTVVSIAWVFMHTLKVEVMDRNKVYSDPDLMTPLKNMVQQKEGNVNKVITAVARNLNILKNNEHLDLDKKYATTLVLFVASQIISTMIMFLVSFLCFKSAAINTLCLVIVLGVLVWNGAIEYFPEEVKEEITTFIRGLSTRHVPTMRRISNTRVSNTKLVEVQLPEELSDNDE
uniref:Glycerophosphocholine acyltransferase 1 n=1 Tax=Aplanochytrium stocchinoi TaxID=215587 RepID=A0A7S3PT83_9STRA|mmetsp:Transcript_3057/g.4123  ORF Transcript_3057/g.4123 Transcript_3057/m.4123 type:complete len:436 (+) Transcript_3057:78-1385(+)